MEEAPEEIVKVLRRWGREAMIGMFISRALSKCYLTTVAFS